MLTAFYEVVTGREPDMLRAFLFAIVLQMLAVNALADFGHITLAVPPFYGFATAVAGFVFGIGMVLSMGCAGAVLYRAGEGKFDSMLVCIAFALGAWLANDWIVVPLHTALYSKTFSVTFPQIVPVHRWISLVVVLLSLGLWLMRSTGRPAEGGWRWPITGMLVGIIGTAAWLVSAKTGKSYGLGTMQGSDGLATLFLEWNISAVNWTAFMVAGIPIGSMTSARIHGKSPGRPLRSKRIPVALAGGLMMGFCAAIAAGDNILHGLSGIPVLALSSALFMIFSFAGAWVGIRLNWLK